MNYIGNKGTNLLMRRNIAQALPLRPHTRRRGAEALPELRRLHRQRLGRTVELQRVQHQARTPRPRGAADVRLYLGQEHRHQVRGSRHRRAGFNGWQGFLDNHDPERDHGLSDFDVDHRLVGSFVYNLPFGQRRDISRRCDRREGSAGRRLAGERHLHLATRFPLTVTARSRRVERQFGTNRADLVGDPNTGGHRASTNGSTPRRSRSPPPDRSAPWDATPCADRTSTIWISRCSRTSGWDWAHEAAVQARVVQRAESHAVQLGGHESHVADIRGGERRPAGRINQLGLKVIF